MWSWLLVVGLGAAALAAPIDDNPISFKCCRESLIEDPTVFKSATGITSLEGCKAFCSANKYGSPVFRKSGWGCAATTFLRCNEVAASKCPSDIIQSGDFYRLYAVSALLTTSITVSRRISGSVDSTIRTDTTDGGTGETDVLGGIILTGFKSSDLGLTEIADRQDRTVDTTKKLIRTLNFNGNTPKIGGRLGGILRAGATGVIEIDNKVAVSKANVSTVAKIDKVTDKEKIDTRDLSAGDRTDFFKSAETSSLSRAGTKKDDRLTIGSTDRTEVTVKGDATVDAGALLGGSASSSTVDTSVPAGLGNIDKGVTVIKVVGSVSTNISGSGSFNTNSRAEVTSVRLLEQDGLGLLSRQKTELVGREVAISVNAGLIKKETDQSVVKKKDVGSIDLTNEKTVGVLDSTTRKVAVNSERTNVTTTKQCGSCVTSGTDITRKKVVDDTIVKATSEFDRRNVNSITSTADKAIVLKGSTGTQTNATVSDSDTTSQELRNKQGTTRAGCNKITGVCKHVSKISGQTLVTSDNKTYVEDVTETKSSTIIVANYQ